ncbi:MAG: PTS sugar transporter subunit IIA [Myxococcota bacterium]|nr:PTS sugar transporter subunit IIA [Myxococcota bacterium]
MIGIVVAAHGKLAESLVDTARQVVKNNNNVSAVMLAPSDDTELFQERLQFAVKKLNTPKGVLVLTDMFGGTPSNVGMTLHAAGEVEVLTGANLPMLIKALQVCSQESNLSTAAQIVKNAGQSAIAVASEVLDVSVGSPPSP